MFGYIADSDKAVTITDLGLINVYMEGNIHVGALVGEGEFGVTISRCYSTGTIKCTSYCGGLLGNTVGGVPQNISNSYSHCSVQGESYIGGLIGGFSDSAINCYSTGSVDGTSNVGGLIGNCNLSKIKNSFWDKATSGQTTSSGGTGKTTSEMTSNPAVRHSVRRN